MLPERPLYPRARDSRTRSLLEPARIRFLRCGMGIMPMLWIAWAGVTAIMLLLIAYRGTITRHEEDQIFLDAASNHQEREQQEIQVKVRKIQPYVRVATGATCALSAGILGIYVWDAVKRLM